MIYKGSPSPAQNMSPAEFFQRVHELKEKEARRGSIQALREDYQLSREKHEYSDAIKDYHMKTTVAENMRREFLGKTKHAFMCSAIMKLYNESMSFKPTEREHHIMEALVDQFVCEQGVNNLLTRFRDQNVLLAEMGRIVRESYQRVLEGLDSIDYTEPRRNESEIPGRAMEFHLNDGEVDRFYDDLGELDTDEASKLIKDKVADAMSDFADQNLQNKTDYTDIINQAKEHIADAKTEGAVEQYMGEARRKIAERREFSKKNAFHCLVESIARESLTDKNLKAQFVHESSVDMNGITRTAAVIYTMLEMVNTTEMVPESYIQNYLSTLVNK